MEFKKESKMDIFGNIIKTSKNSLIIIYYTEYGLK